MITQIGKQLATQIVDTVHDVCGHDINFINKNGIIYASTNTSRIGSFHEIGKKCCRYENLSLKYRIMTTTKEPAAELIFLLHTTDISLLLSE